MSRRVEAGAALRIALPNVEELHPEDATPRPADELHLSAPESARRLQAQTSALPHVSKPALHRLRAGLDVDLPGLFAALPPEHAATLHGRVEAVSKMAALLDRLSSLEREVTTHRRGGAA